jgi:thioredoxin reductase
VERTPVVELLGDAPGLEAVRLADGRVIPLQALFTAPNVRMASPPAEGLGCAFEQGALGPYLRVDDWKQTTVAGVYAGEGTWCIGIGLEALSSAYSCVRWKT